MDPFKPNRNWYEDYWYSEQAKKSPWRVPAAVASLAGLVLAAWLG